MICKHSMELGHYLCIGEGSGELSQNLNKSVRAPKDYAILSGRSNITFYAPKTSNAVPPKRVRPLSSYRGELERIRADVK